MIEKLLNGVPAKKSDAELKMENALRRYEKHFGKPLPIGYGATIYEDFDAVTKTVEQCIKTGIAAPEPQYDDDKIY